MSNTDFDIPVVVTAAGAQPTPPATLLADLIAQVSATNPGYTANLPGSLIENISSTDVGALVMCDTARVETINSISPFTANDFLLLQLGQIYIGPGAAPGVPTNTSVYVVITATDTETSEPASGVVFGTGFTVSDGTYQYIVQSPGGITGASGQTLPLFCIAVVAGSWPVPTNTVTQFVTQPPAGISITLTNPSPGQSSSAAETAEAFRARVLQAGQAIAQGMPTFLKTLLGQVPGVQQNLISVRQQIGGGWEVICGGGDPYQIAFAIYQAIPDVSTLTGSILAVSNITNANPGVVTTTLNHGFASGQVVTINGLTGMTELNGEAVTITVLTEKTFSVGEDTTGFPPYVSGGIVTPNLRNQTPSIYDAPDTYTIPFVVPPVQTVTMVATWTTTEENFTSEAAVAAAVQPALASYVNGIVVGQPMSLILLEGAFVAAVSPLLDPSTISDLTFSVSINGVPTSPVGQLIFGDPESSFSTTTAGIVVTQGA